MVQHDVVCKCAGVVGAVLFMELNVVSGKNRLVFNHVHINCIDKAMSFPEFDASDEFFVPSKKVDKFMKDEAEVFMILNFMKA